MKLGRTRKSAFPSIACGVVDPRQAPRARSLGRCAGRVARLLPVLFGCAFSPACSFLFAPSSPPPEAPRDSAPPAEAAPVEATGEAHGEALRTLLDAAERALAEDRLTTPTDDCAHLYYSQALALAPENDAVQRGFERIVERYLALAQTAIERETWAQARSMLDRAALVDAQHPGIDVLRRQARLLANAERLTLKLDRDAVRRRLPESAQRLAAFGAPARRANARVRIRAASDADGRWIYRQLATAPGERRIRAGIEIGVPPQVTILLLPAGGDTTR